MTIQLWTKPKLGEWNGFQRCDENGDAFLVALPEYDGYSILYIPAYGRGIRVVGASSDVFVEVQKEADELWDRLRNYNPPTK